MKRMASSNATTSSPTTMSTPSTSTGYGPRGGRPYFNGSEEQYELWEMKFIGYCRLQKLHDSILPPAEGGVATGNLSEVKNAEAFAELCLALDDRSLSLIIRDAKNDGRKSLEILRQHYMAASEMRVIGLYTELTSLKKSSTETLTDYLVRAETASAQLKNAGETVSENLLIAMILKGLPDSFQSFVTVTTQRKERHTLASFKQALRTYEETVRSTCGDNVMTIGERNRGGQRMRCFNCGGLGHRKWECRQPQHESRRDERKSKRWCEHCKTTSHDTKFCRKLNSKSNAKTVDVSDSYAFKVSVDVKADCVNALLVDTGATTHIINDETKFRSFDDSFQPNKHFIELADGSQVSGLAKGRGDAVVSLVDRSGRVHDAVLKDALYVPSFKQDIFSVQCATQKGSVVTFKENISELKCADGNVFEIKKHGQLYFLNGATNVDKAKHSLKEWHEILGHCNTNDILKLESVVEGMKITNHEMNDCTVCIQGKMTDTRSRIPDSRANAPFEFVHCDLAGPVTPIAREGFRYAICFTDDYTSLVTVYFLKSKDDTVEATKKFLADIAPFGNVKRLRSDNGGEFISKEFKQLMLDHKIKHETSSPRSPHQNGSAERQWRTLFDMARCMLLESGLPQYLWNYAVMHAAYVRNRCFNARLGKTPFEAVTGKKPNVGKMHRFGSQCFALVDEKKKLDARSEEGVFLGHDRDSPAFIVYFPDQNKMRKVRCVRFTERFVQEEDSVLYPHEVTEQNQNQDKVEMKSDVKSDIETGTQTDSECKYPTRERKAPKYLDDYVCSVNDADITVDCCYRVSFVPQCYKEAVKCDESQNWQKAMDSEMESLAENDTFVVTELPKGKNVIGGKWVYATKSDADGNVKFKARYVARGFSQKESVDYGETFAPTARMTSIRMLMQAAVDEELLVHQMDVKTAYLNAPIDCELYVDQPEGYCVNDKSDRKLVWKLKKSLYGLKQSGRNWNSVLHSYLCGENFDQSDADPCVYRRVDDQGKVLILVWVDDIIVAASNEVLLKNVKESLSDRFRMKDLGELRYFLGIEFSRTEGCIKMSQKQYSEKVLSRFGMSECNPRKSPCNEGLDKDIDNSPLLRESGLYREIVGSLIYLMTATRPDLSYSVTKLAQKMSNPSENDMNVAKGVLRYLKGTSEYGLEFKKSGDKAQIQGHCDSDWASSYSDRKSISAYVFWLERSSSFISWKSKKQNIVALSSCEAEYIALSYCVQEAIFLQKLLATFYEEDCRISTVRIGVDNQGCIALAKNPVHQQRSKHIDVRYHFLRNVVSDRIVELYHVPSRENIADVLTKPVSQYKIRALCK